VTAQAQQPPNADRVNEIAKKLNCPTCTGINLADCRTQTCAQWRAQIGDLLAAGYSDEEVLAYFATHYGEQVLQEPPKSGATLPLWVLPVVALLVGGGWLAYALSKISPAGPASSSALVGDEYLEQVEQDLQRGD
jgi:cytochrome c-type biogenesis protein CcmH